MVEPLLIASNNPGKHRELVRALGGLPYDVVTLAERGIRATIEEVGATFEENASLKATAYAAMSGLLTLADDSGLEVDALGGEPGVHSARYGGADLNDAGRMFLVLERAAALGSGERAARFVCVIAIAEDGGEPVLFRGECVGVLTEAPRGAGGFGYDPIFLPEGETRTMAELSIDEKAAISHRGRAIALARTWLAERTRVRI
ncbi:MAG: RdgB/HAM1 family non-canonical purine NTP pyrophosphatase [Dehalococcoidia bacterium]